MLNAATMRPMGLAGHCPTIVWHFILISYMGILLFRLLPSVSLTVVRRRRLETHSFQQRSLMLLGAECSSDRWRSIEERTNLHGACRFHERSLICFFGPRFLITPGQNLIRPSHVLIVRHNPAIRRQTLLVLGLRDNYLVSELSWTGWAPRNIDQV